MRAVRITEGVNAFKDFVISQSAKNPNAFFHVFFTLICSFIMNGFGKIVTKKYFTVAFPLPFPINNGYIHMYMRASE